MIPLVDLKAQYLSIKEEVDTAMQHVIDDCSFIGGKNVTSFEGRFASYIGVNHCIGCANGTDAIEILLKAMDIGIGDEVIVPAVSWISTSEAVSSVGARPIFVDIDPSTYTIDCNLIEEKLSERTKAIIPVHLYGHPADMNKIMAIAKKNNLFVLEDCAQAHGAKIDGRKVGSFGDCASFSFYPGKNLGAYGDAGCMVTNNEALAAKSRMITNHGQIEKHHHLLEGRNSRLDAIHASVLNVKLDHIDTWNQARQKNASYYTDQLASSNIIVPTEKYKCEHVFHLYVIKHKKRDQLKEFLQTNGIGVAIHYPVALPFLGCYSHLSLLEEDFPVASKHQQEILSLPMYPELRQSQMKFVVEKIKEFDESSNSL